MKKGTMVAVARVGAEKNSCIHRMFLSFSFIFFLFIFFIFLFKETSIQCYSKFQTILEWDKLHPYSYEKCYMYLNLHK
jgi:flagellar biogenesis protein FliO